MYTICLENRIAESDVGFKCYLCDCLIQKNVESIFHHTEDVKHNTILSTTRNNIDESKLLNILSEFQKQTIVENRLTLLKNIIFYCHNCKCRVFGFHNILEHIKGVKHKKLFNIALKVNTDESKEIIPKSIYRDIFYCLICKIYLKNTSMLQCHNMLHLHKEVKFPWNNDIIKYEFEQNKNVIIKCLLCNSILLNEQNLSEHLITRIHVERLNYFLSVKQTIKLDNMVKIVIDDDKLAKIESEELKNIKITLCTICNVPVPNGTYDLSVHENGKNHTKNAEQFTEMRVDNTYDNLNIDDWNFYTCFICKLSFLNLKLLLNHYNESRHKVKIKCFNMINQDSDIVFVRNKQEKIQCTACNIKVFSSAISVVDHLLGKRHQLKNTCSDKHSVNNSIISKNVLKSLDSNMYKTNNEFINNPEILVNSSIKSNIEQVPKPKSNDELNNLLDNLINIHLQDKQMKKLPQSLIKRYPKKNVKSKNNIFILKEDINISDSFFQLCIYPGDKNIYNFDLEKVRLIQLGSSLICPYNSELICLACGYELKNDIMSLFEHFRIEEHIDNLYAYEKDDKLFEEYPDQFSDLKLAKSYMMVESVNLIKCFACNVSVNNDNDDIILHLKLSKHIFKTKLVIKLFDEIYLAISTLLNDMWYYAQMFYCEVCNKNFTFEIDFVKHLINSMHITTCNKLEIIGNTLKYDICPVCMKVWYGKSKYSLHCEDQLHKYYIRNGDFSVPKMTADTIDLLNNVDEKIDFLINLSDKAKGSVVELLNNVKETIENIYPNARIYTFGSRVSNLGFPDSDVDVFIDCNDNYVIGLTQKQCQQCLLSMQKCFQNKRNLWLIEELVFETRVPILKLKYRLNGQACDISCNSGLSVEKSKLIGYYTAAYPVCRQLILYLKKWLQFCQISGSDSITTFAISWFVIFYLQISGIFPSVYTLIKENNQSKVVDGWECGFTTVSINYSDLGFKDHLRNLFSYFADFDYKKNVVCPYLGKVLEKRCFTSISQLPNEMEIYKNRLKTESIYFRWDSALCIQDPIDLSQNITKAVKKYKLRCFKEYSKYSVIRI